MDSKRLHRIIISFHSFWCIVASFPGTRGRWQSSNENFLVGGYSQKRPYTASSYPPVWTSALSKKCITWAGWWGDFQGQAAKNFIWLLWQWWNTRSWNGRCVWFGKKKVLSITNSIFFWNVLKNLLKLETPITSAREAEIRTPHATLHTSNIPLSSFAVIT